ncbi:MAG: methanethiol S-methyltransferase [Caulobacteraceae bacterium]
MSRIAILLYGLIVYAAFFLTFLYAIGFVTDLVVPKTIDSGVATPLAAALIIDLVVLGIFAIQHSVMARPAFKRWWTRLVPGPAERSTYVLLSTLALALILWQWRPIPGVAWRVGDPNLAATLTVLSLVGWGVVLVSTFLINHFELFGLQQVFAYFTGREPIAPSFKTPLFYKAVRHPIYVGFIIAFWAAPVMTWGHLLFALGTTGYIFIGIFFEERDLVGAFGDTYRDYRARVAMIVPFWPKAAAGKTRRPA